MSITINAIQAAIYGVGVAYPTVRVETRERTAFGMPQKTLTVHGGEAWERHAAAIALANSLRDAGLSAAVTVLSREEAERGLISVMLKDGDSPYTVRIEPYLRQMVDAIYGSEFYMTAQLDTDSQLCELEITNRSGDESYILNGDGITDMAMSLLCPMEQARAYIELVTDIQCVTLLGDGHRFSVPGMFVHHIMSDLDVGKRVCSMFARFAGTCTMQITEAGAELRMSVQPERSEEFDLMFADAKTQAARYGKDLSLAISRVRRRLPLVRHDFNQVTILVSTPVKV